MSTTIQKGNCPECGAKAYERRYSAKELIRFCENGKCDYLRVEPYPRAYTFDSVKKAVAIIVVLLILLVLISDFGFKILDLRFF